jgi:hypothetical protein
MIGNSRTRINRSRFSENAAAEAPVQPDRSFRPRASSLTSRVTISLYHCAFVRWAECVLWSAEFSFWEKTSRQRERTNIAGGSILEDERFTKIRTNIELGPSERASGSTNAARTAAFRATRLGMAIATKSVRERSSLDIKITNLRTHAESYVTTSGLADYWQVSRKQIYKQIDAGTLVAIRLGPRSLRISTAEAIRFEEIAKMSSPSDREAMREGVGREPLAACGQLTSCGDAGQERRLQRK